MIKEDELLEAIAECQGQRNPNANTCVKLASYYTILDHLKGSNDTQPMYSFAAENITDGVIRYNSGTEFSDAIHGKDANEILSVIDELMDTLSVLNPPLYKSVIRRVAQ